MRWSKPALGLYEDSTGSLENNLYLPPNSQDHNRSVLYTPHLGDGRTYTLLSYGPERPQHGASDGYYIAFSDDGLRWTDGVDGPVIPGHQGCWMVHVRWRS